MAGRSPTVSVVIPAYNAAAFISETLDTVRAQTYKDYEIVLVDDGSQDGTHKAAAGYLGRHRLPGQAILQENKKIAGARNTGMRAARGEYIALLDHDDLWHPKKLEFVMREFSRYPKTDLVGHHIAVTKNGRTLRVLRKGPACAGMYERLLLKGNAVSPSAAVFRKDKALSIGGFDEAPELVTVEDYDFWMRLSKIGTFRFVDKVLSEYPLRETSASHRMSFHHRNLELLVERHFREHFGGRPGFLDRLRMRRRRGSVYRSALGQLIETGGSAQERRHFALKMLRTDPFSLKNIGRALQWLGHRLF